MPAKRLDSLLNPNENGGLGDVVRRARGMGELTERLRRALGRELGTPIVAANVRDDGTLVVLVESPAWAARLRFEADALIAAAGRTKPPVARCEVRVAHGATGGQA
ncbi:MAG: DciA family protein [Woeseiaceae bacterium]|nr:DciA family protein [Woeseiaceae bacterium]